MAEDPQLERAMDGIDYLIRTALDKSDQADRLRALHLQGAITFQVLYDEASATVAVAARFPDGALVLIATAALVLPVEREALN